MRRAALLGFALGAGALAVMIAYAGGGAVAAALARFGVGGFLTITGLHLAVVAILGVAWWSVGCDSGQARLWKFIWARLIRESATEVLPFSQIGGFVIGARALALTGLHMAEVAVSMLLDLVLELAAKLPYMLIGGTLLLLVARGAELIQPMALASALTAVGLAALVAWRRRLKIGLENAAIALAGRFPGLGLGADEEIRPAFDRLVARDRRVLLSFTVHLLCWALGAFETWVMFQLIGVPITPVEAVVIDSLVGGFRTAGIAVPSALGVQEGGYVLICAFFGIPPAVALAVSLARRAREFAIGAPGLVIWQAVEGHRVFARLRPQ